MSEAPTIGHNKAPVVIPKEDELLDTLQNRYPEIPKKLEEFEEAFKGYPAELTLDKPDVAEAFQDLLGQVAKEQRVWSAHEKGEKGPINKLVKVVTNFFTKVDEKADALIAANQPKYDAFLDKKKKAEVQRQEEEAERQRKKEIEDRARAEKAAQEVRDREAAAEAARKSEQEALAAAARAKQEKEDADARAAAALAQERQLAEEKRIRDREEKEKNILALRDIKAYMKTAERIHAQAEADEANDAELEHLDGLIKHGGTVGQVAGPIRDSAVLTEEQHADLAEIKDRLDAMRTAQNARFNKRELARREKARLAHEKQEAEAAAIRKAQRDAEDKRLADAKKAREVEEAAAEKARDDKRKAEAEARAHGGEAKTAESGAKQASRDMRTANEDADRSANRADRVEGRLARSTEADLTRTRGDLGTVGRQQRRWVHHIKDENALMKAVLDQCSSPVISTLLSRLEPSDLNGAVYRYMRMHQDGWKMNRRERVEDAIPGVVFAYELESVIS